MKWILNLLRPFYILYAIILFLTLVLIGFPIIIFFSLALNAKRAHQLSWVLARFIANVCLWGFGMPLQVIHPPHINKGNKGPFIYVCNHWSYLDALAPLVALPTRTKFLGKGELLKYPLWRHVYRIMVIPVFRAKATSRQKSYAQMIKTIQNGVSIFVFPEGTFNETEHPLIHFKKGAFRLALETKVDIIPMVLVDTKNRMHWRSIYSLNPGSMRVVFLPRIATHSYSEKNLDKLMDKVHASMSEALIQYS